jgi:hypothetical protein
MKNKFDPQEGLYYEKVFSPEKVEVFRNVIESAKTEVGKQPPKKLRFETRLVLSDKRGHKLEVKGKRLVHRVLQYLQPWTSFGSVGALAELEEADPQKLQATLTHAAKKSKRQLKTYFDAQGELQGIASQIHQQISWAKIREVVEGAVKKAYHVVAQPDQTMPTAANKWTYKMPVKDKNNNVSAYVTVDGGNNIIKGKSGIRVSTRLRTDRGGPGGAPACLNWCGMWMVPLQFFGVKTERLGLKDTEETQLNMLELHLKSTAEGMNEIEAILAAKMKNMAKVVEKKLLPIIEESRHVALTKKEMKAILEAYAEKTHLPKYIIEQILDSVEENTVWGFSNAVSWVRTHGQFDERRSQLSREQRPLTQILENIAGEVLSITPTIKKLKAVLKGPITQKALMKPEQYPELKAMVVKQS